MNLQRENLGDLAKEIVEDSQKLFRQEAELFKEELKDDFANIKRALIFLIIAASLITTGTVLLSLTVVHLLVEIFAAPLWLSYAILSVVVLVTSGLLARYGSGLAVDLFPRETVESVKENVRCLKKRIF